MARAVHGATEDISSDKWIEHPYKPGVILPVHRRPVRATGIDYTSRDCRCFVTYCLDVREPLLVGAVGETAWNALLEEQRRIGFVLHTACMMPDHVHALLAPSGEGKIVSDIVRSLKLCQTNRVRQRHGVWLKWQLSFYDHVLRDLDRHAEVTAIAEYIADNPFRTGLTDTPETYPFTHRRAGATRPAASQARSNPA